ncbi:MAG: hypothetical protein HQK53_00600 [Oligoflexia bacterium]|nr:hypothetical protein [Oligoflexia bacterium]
MVRSIRDILLMSLIYRFRGNIIEDLYSIARGDLILGPPSTYSGWAAWYANIPLVNLNRSAPIDDEKVDAIYQQVMAKK